LKILIKNGQDLFNRREQNKNWKFSLSNSSSSKETIPYKKIKSGKWFPAEVPGTIHTDLLNNNLIEDPFYADNELKLNWIAYCDWIYQTEFDFEDEAQNNVSLVFEGLDTICEIYLNDVKLGDADNMFLSYRFDIKNILKPSGNLLKLIFKSPVKYALQQEEKYGKLPVALNSGRVYIRKAQYSFGWDWGPSFPTSGIWRNVYLEERSRTFIKNFSIVTQELSAKKALVCVKIFLNDKPGKKQNLNVTLSNKEQKFEKIIKIKSIENEIQFEIKNPKPWWPNGEGEQNLYDLEIILFDAEKILDHLEKKIGIRTISLQLKENDKSTFRFVINNKPVFAKGVNWIPADSFIPRVSHQKYETLLNYAKDANMNFVRVWGGGFYENDVFYELCDSLGLLVWQDFMFACAAYPQHKEFLNSVEEEVRQNVQRLQYHPSIAIWCGNNENEWIWYQEQKTSYKKMPGYKIYHDLIPKILKEIDASRSYWPSSPFGSGEDPNSYSSGNRHEWGIWSKWIDYSEVKNDRSLFVTEFGFQGPANKDTLEKYLPQNSRNVSDKIFEHHNKQIEGPERIIKFLSSHLPIKTEWDDYLYLTQLNQAFALKTCLEYWQTNGKTNGSIIWQLNDCWPVTSWALIDSDIKPKLAYYFVKNTFAPRFLYFKDEGSKIKIILLNKANEKIKSRLRLTIISTVSGEIINDSYFKVNIDHKKLREINSIVRKKLPGEENWIITAVLYTESNKIICRNYYLNKPWKHIRLKKTKLILNALDKSNSTELILKANHPVFFVDLYHPNLTFSDRGFFILPGEQIQLKVIGKQYKTLNLKDIKINSLNNYLHG